MVLSMKRSRTLPKMISDHGFSAFVAPLGSFLLTRAVSDREKWAGASFFSFEDDNFRPKTGAEFPGCEGEYEGANCSKPTRGAWNHISSLRSSVPIHLGQGENRTDPKLVTTEPRRCNRASDFPYLGCHESVTDVQRSRPRTPAGGTITINGGLFTAGVPPHAPPAKTCACSFANTPRRPGHWNGPNPKTPSLPTSCPTPPSGPLLVVRQWTLIRPGARIVCKSRGGAGRLHRGWMCSLKRTIRRPSSRVMTP